MVKARITGAWILLIGSLIAWPVTAMTVFRDEPQGILGLSWYGNNPDGYIDILSTQDVRREQG